MEKFTKAELHSLRNELPIKEVIEKLGIPNKITDGIFRFLCPECGEFQTATDERTNLSRCFLCKKNYNTIEIVMQDRKVAFIKSVLLLKTMLQQTVGSR
jgi:predicted RNA-binding Zn-ribbon protein involved in translation (DUF1610 family)